MLAMYNRMCWNSRGWRLPTNTASDSGYPQKMGFGHEEWNFQIEDAVDGFVYGYLYYIPSEKKLVEAKGHFKIGFWSMHPETRKRLIVGMYKDATLATENDFIRLNDAFSRRGIYERRARELCDVVSSLSFEEAKQLLMKSIRDYRFKCPIEQIIHCVEYIPVDKVVRSRKLGAYFTRPTFVLDNELPILRKYPRAGGSTVSKSRLASGSALAEDAYYRESPTKRDYIIPRHNRLSNAFAKWLSERGFFGILQEENFVDVTFTYESKVYLAELKTCYGVGTTKAIREALGQLLEYNYYPGRELSNVWVIVLDEQPSIEDITYIRRLKSVLSLPLCLGWNKVDDGDFLFAEGLGLEQTTHTASQTRFSS
jgi:hypothetical protein